jgi:hypothetical protein
VPELIDAGVTVGLGADTHNCDIFLDMKAAFQTAASVGCRGESDIRTAGATPAALRIQLRAGGKAAFRRNRIPQQVKKNCRRRTMAPSLVAKSPPRRLHAAAHVQPQAWNEEGAEPMMMTVAEFETYVPLISHDF